MTVSSAAVSHAFLSNTTMIGSPDVVAFTKEDEYGQTNTDPWALPEEFSIPLHPLADSNPWAKTSYAKFTKDFILISEFSEQVGPQPLLTIPNDPKVCGTFDLNYFSLRIMSVDYQASFVGHPPGSGYPRLSFVEDSRVVLGDSKEGAFAYVHHLTLYDLEARGFVRPFCMAYVAADERKIMLQFQELSLRFSQASECLKAGNRRAFAKELQRKLKDLEYTHSVLQREEGLQREAGPQCMYSAHAVEKANELANVEKSIYEHRDLLKQISSYHRRPRRDPHAVTCQKCMSECLSQCEELLDKYAKLAEPFSYSEKGGKGKGGRGWLDDDRGEEEVDEEEDEGVKRKPSYTPQLIKAKSAKCFDKRLKTLQELCDETFYEATVELLKETERSFRGDLCYLHTRRLDKALRRKLTIVNFLFEEELADNDDDELGTLRPFCAVNHTIVNYINLNPPHIVLGPEPLELDAPEAPGPLDPASKTSATQDGELGLGENHLESSPSDQTLETQESSEETKGSFSSDKSGTDQTEKHESLASIRSEGPDPDSDLTPDPDHNTDPERESSSEEMETTAGEDEGDIGDQTPVSLLEVVSELEACKEDEVEAVNESDLLVPIDTACCMAQEGFLYEASAPDVHTQPSQTLVVNQEPQALLPLQDDYTVGSPCSESPAAGLELPVGIIGDTVSRTSMEDGSDCTMSASTGSDRAASPLGYGGVVTLRQRKKAGQSALRFVRQYPFAMQALWCLLSGRTLVVLGTDEGRVRRLVAALALFVPGPGKCGERVQAWLSCPFTLTDLQRWKLIGLQRVASPVGSSMLYSLSRYSRYISILDADQKTLRCLPYHGQLLANIADHRTYIRRGSTYFLHLQSMLCRLAAKAFLLTFTHHLHLPVSSTEGLKVVDGRRRSFLQEQLGLDEEDSQILVYLSQLITQQYLQPANGSSAAAPCFTFDYTANVLYKI
ncbi:guanine nucleotide exchange protein smcr8a [Melanotaenia boesemani]|uniref:guanine nucleotide exchange protein smcr8a n=1 Tax=Melanotaenia boesemani TaxID=1250792 RepID=UPI001C04EC2F|nr:guanine nucleotide exchange protein smcr8a [Melanotaenia boesemani]